ncbi:hypothetical protein RIF29_37900 [Crotalaria pallida]|uniref:Uncharacterized protein n=1 Tax=Crotalaria pallida TaxID=3830 RepID=A0AAN9DYL0_CROPI
MMRMSTLIIGGKVKRSMKRPRSLVVMLVLHLKHNLGFYVKEDLKPHNLLPKEYVLDSKEISVMRGAESRKAKRRVAHKEGMESSTIDIEVSSVGPKVDNHVEIKKDIDLSKVEFFPLRVHPLSERLGIWECAPSRSQVRNLLVESNIVGHGHTEQKALASIGPPQVPGGIGPPGLVSPVDWIT